MELPLAARMERLGTETAFEVLARAKALEAEGRDILHLEVGEPDFDTPSFVVDAAAEALRGGWTRYGPAPGLPEVRHAVAERTAATRGVPVRPEEVVVSPGAKPLLFFTALALVDEGDEVLVPDPGFPIYASVARFAGGTVVPYSLPEARGFAPDPDEIASLLTPRTKLVVLNSPGNPAGGVLGGADLDRTAEAIRASDAWVLSDEIYADFLYDGTHESILARPGMRERTVLVDGMSKSWAMTGWRAGWGVMPEALAERVTRLQINSVSCTASFTQRAMAAALAGPRDSVLEMVAAFRRRRDLLVEGLNSVRGFRCALPRGAFYVFPSVEGTGRSGREVAGDLLEEAGVACVPGTSFGASGERFVRFSFARSEARLLEAVDRIRERYGAA